MVNSAIVAAAPYRAQVRVIDTVAIFTPGFKYAPRWTSTGADVVRESDGIHLNDEGSSVAAEVVLDRVGDDFTY